ncbi:UNVERIFIED_CONTAM: hypothetical protein HDU68_006624 [Siphonaria sp. JEL0065]|nr:hypothetical protein HDU68_006624 [Siphonaria sp. JEL0065]
MPVNASEFPNHLESSAPQYLLYLSSTIQHPSAKPFSTASNMHYESPSALQPHNLPTVLRGPGGINLLDSPCNSPVLGPIGEASSSRCDLNLDDHFSSSLHPESSTSDYKDCEDDAAHSDMSYLSNRQDSPFDDPEFSAFARPCTLQVHYNEHNNIRPFECTNCPIKFTRKHDLLRHERTVHSKGKPTSCCCNCGMSFSRSDALRRHEKSCNA